jgi:hypothetical protein
VRVPHACIVNDRVKSSEAVHLFRDLSSPGDTREIADDYVFRAR